MHVAKSLVTLMTKKITSRRKSGLLGQHSVKSRSTLNGTLKADYLAYTASTFVQKE